MKKVMAIALMLGMLALCTGAVAQEMTLRLEYDDGTSAQIAEGETVYSDGELFIVIDGLQEGAAYRVEFTGETIDGQAFSDHQGFVSDGTGEVYLSLTDRAGVYGPFELRIHGSGMSETISFSADVKPDPNKKEWLAYGVLNDLANAMLPPFLPVTDQETDPVYPESEDLRIREPADGAVLSGFPYGEISFGYEALEPNTDVMVRIRDTVTGSLKFEIGMYFPEPDRRGAILEFADMFEFDREYVFEVESKKSCVSARFTLVEETGGSDEGVQQIMEARERQNAQYHHEDGEPHEDGEIHGDGVPVRRMDESTQAILDGSARFEFAPVQLKQDPSAAGKAYDRLAEAFNARVGGYAVGMQFENGLYKYDNAEDSGGIFQSWACAGNEKAILRPQPDVENAAKQLNQTMTFGLQVSQVYQQIMGDAASALKLPVHLVRVAEKAQGRDGNLSCQPIAHTVFSDGGVFIADFMLYAIRINEQVAEDHRYIYARFADPFSDGSQFYAWNIADQKLVQEIIGLMGESQAPQGSAQQQDAPEAEEKAQRFVQIRKDGSVNVRQKSNADSRRVGTAKANAKYPLLSVAKNGWFEIQLEDGTSGFVSPKMAKVLD